MVTVAVGLIEQELVRRTTGQSGEWHEAWCASCRQQSARVAVLRQWDNHVPGFIISSDAVTSEAVQRLVSWRDIRRNQQRMVITIHGSNCPGCGTINVWESIA